MKNLTEEIRIGWNIGNTMDAFDEKLPDGASPAEFETAWHNPQVTQELIDAVLAAGFHLVRIPTTWKDHIGPAPDFAIRTSWLDRVQEIVDYAYKRGAYVILNLHHEDWNYPYYDNEQAACEKMRAVWGQIAERFADYDEHLIFEAQNEPRKAGTPMEWNGGDEEGWDVVNRTNRAFITAVRASSGKNRERYLMIPGYAANCRQGIRHLEVPEGDARLIASVHAYEPYEFALNKEGRSVWEHDTADIDALSADLKELFLDKGIPVIIGECGAMSKHNEKERVAWAHYFIGGMKKLGVPCVWWDNGIFEGEGETFGLIDRSTCEWRYPKVLQALMEATA